ncbi:BrnA antitoxin family protein [Zavarzinia compransoris]|uniref:BrnA antitoxin family protein n=1 Tax=Zavarzinia marina TaxID=2911065 RepID=UPI001F3608D2|nr:BrnA antitoxin family protein [Zavarzinia marina]MCF4165114.1 BrnA antitoxin family protein [Zavarzinia marina]
MTEFEPGHGFTKQDWDDVCDNPEWTAADIAKARSFAEVFPDLAESIKRMPGRPKSDRPKVQTTIRLSQDVLDHFKADGPGWQRRIDEALKKVAGLK